MRMIRLAIVTLLAAALLAACGGGGGTPTPSFDLTLQPSSSSVAQGGSTEVTVNIARRGGFAGPVTVTLVNPPDGISADPLTIAAGQNSGTLTVRAAGDAAVTASNLTVRGTSGSLSDDATLVLTVTAAAGENFTISLNPATLSVAQGGSATTTVNVARDDGFTGPVQVTLVSPPTGVSADPLTVAAGQTSGTLTVRATEGATVGTSTVVVRGASGDSTDDAQLNLTVSEAAAGDDFTIALTNANLTLAPGGSVETTVTISRQGGFTGAVDLAFEGDNAGTGAAQISGTFTPNPVTGGSSTLRVSVGSEVAPGEYSFTVRGTGGNTDRPVTLTVTVAQSDVLLVDDDTSSNNYSPDDPNAALSDSDTRFRQALDALNVGYDVYVVPANENGPNFDQLQNYQTVIWYTGSGQGFSPNVQTISSTDELNLQAYLDLGERKAILFSPGYLRAYSDRRWDAISNTFVNSYIGATRGRFDFNEANLTASGVADTVTAGLTLQVAGNDAIRGYTSVLEPAEGTVTLLTVPMDPDDSGTVRPIAIATGRPAAGAAGTSDVIFVGLAFENIVNIGANSQQALMGRLLDF